MFKVVLVEKINDFFESEDYVLCVGIIVIGKINFNLVDENVFVFLEEVWIYCFFLFF